MESRPPSFGRIVAAAVVVGAIAMVLRMPSCYESFWLDELHSAWTVWGKLSDVSPRASAGHQSPFYFIGLWFWKQLIGDSELALRMSSVLATSFACATLTIGVARWGKSLAAGVMAGLVLAIESNAIFYGTELRPYAFVILLASIVTTSFLALSESNSRFERPALWSVLIITILLATLMQPTSLGVLMLFPLALLVLWGFRDRREITRLRKLDAVLLLAAFATLLTLWRLTLDDSWLHRSQWAAFGSATSIKQLTEVWNWLWLLLAPLGVVAVVRITSHRPDQHRSRPSMSALVVLLALIAVVATCLYWLVSWIDWAPLWHRRYFVAVLPVLAAICGGAVGVVSQWPRLQSRGQTVAAILTLLLLLGLSLHQRTLPALTRYPIALAIRGEGWREAIQWINQTATEADQIYLDPDLIESNALLTSHEVLRTPDDPLFNQYLTFPVRGPYQVDHTVRLCNVLLGWMLDAEGRSLAVIPSSHGKTLLLVRRAESRLESIRREGDEVVTFGGVSVIVKPERVENPRF